MGRLTEGELLAWNNSFEPGVIDRAAGLPGKAQSFASRPKPSIKASLVWAERGDSALRKSTALQIPCQQPVEVIARQLAANAEPACMERSTGQAALHLFADASVL